jgi:molybdopterin-guanine dinucleotide biosynthesis protein A
MDPMARPAPPTRLPVTLLLLAGGESRRMGRPKPLLPVAGTTLIEWQLGRLAPHFAHFLIAARSEDQVPSALRSCLVRDLHRAGGPLAGIESGLAATPHGAVLALACDMPSVTLELARRLVAAAGPDVDAAVPRLEGRPEPACAVYRTSAAGPIAAALGEGRLKAADALAGLRVRWLDSEDGAQFANLNTPADYRAFRERLETATTR